MEKSIQIIELFSPVEICATVNASKSKGAYILKLSTKNDTGTYVCNVCK